MSNRKLDALRNLAERPGTEAEGILAREMLARLENSRNSDKPEWERPLWSAFEDYLSGKINRDEFVEGLVNLK